MTAALPSATSGFCGINAHQRCPGGWKTWECNCDCHQEPPPPVEPRRVQVRRGEVWRTDPDGSWRAIAVVDRGDHPTLDAAVLTALAGLGVNPEEYQP